MKKTYLKKIILSVFVLTINCQLSTINSMTIAPYYNFQFTQGASIPSRGDWYFTVNLINNLGVIAKLHQKHSMLGFFELKYSGPGLKRYEGERFADRYLNYLTAIRHNWLFRQDIIFKSQVDYLKENRRTGANEAWGFGLYDYSRLGGLISAEKLWGSFKTEIGLQYHFLEFPNYTDLLKEYQQATTEAETESGKQNHHLIQLRSSFVYKENKFGLNIALQSYTKQKVITNIVQQDGTYYSPELQKDIITSVYFDRTQKLSPKINLMPSLSLRTRTSNQNYQHFTTVGSTVPVSYQPRYYNYSQIIIGLPISFQLSKKLELLTNPELDYKFYHSRPPRDTNNNFIATENQYNSLFLLTLALNKKSSDVSTITLFYTFQSQTSNMKFERYLPYNYSGHFAGLKYELRY